MDALRSARPFLAGALAALLLSCVAMPDASAAPTRFRCTLVDGSTTTVDRDLSLVYPASVPKCQPLPGDDPDAVATRDAWARASQSRVSTSMVFTWIDTIRKAQSAPLVSSRQSARRVVRAVNTSAFAADIAAASHRYAVDVSLLYALIYVESRFDPKARSPRGAVGLMQVMPSTGARYGVTSARDLADPSINIDIGTRYLSDLAALFPGRTDLVLAAYNAGETSVVKNGYRVPPFVETRNYVRQIISMLPVE